MAIEHRSVQFRSTSPEELIAEIEAIRGRGRDTEWVTISPFVALEDVPETTMLRRLFTTRGPKIPEVTWVPAGDGSSQLGVLHAMGNDAGAQLSDLGVEVPAGFQMIQDHTRRGLLFAVVASAETATIVSFSVAAARALSAVPTDDRWVSQISVA